MRSFVLSLLFFFLLVNAPAQMTLNGSFIHGGITRTYSFYVPASYVHGQPIPLVIGLHGTGSDGDEFAHYRDFRPIADTARFIMVHPDGSTMFGVRFWNYGDVFGSTVDDVGFLEALIDTISALYTIDASRIYCTGMSNGSFMSYKLACQSNRFAAIAGVTGSMSTGMYDACSPVYPIPTLHIHGTNDGVNPYNGTSTMKAVEEVSRFWVLQNGCDTVPIITSIPDTDPGDGATASRYLYDNGINGHTVEFFKVTGGEHTWPGSPMPGSTDITCMDFDARKEIWRFFSQYQRDPLAIADHRATGRQPDIYPNPATGTVYINAGQVTVTGVLIMDLQGRVLEQKNSGNIAAIDLSALRAGTYLLGLSGKGFYTVKKLVVAPAP